MILETCPARLTWVRIGAHRAGPGHVVRLTDGAGIAGGWINCRPEPWPRTRGETHGRLTAANDVRDKQQTTEQRAPRVAGVPPRHRIVWMDGQW